MMAGMLCLLAHVAERGLLFDADAVESVVDLDAIVPAPRTPPTIRGLAALRSRVVTVVDTRELLGLPRASDGAARAVVVNVEGHAYALLVDTLEDVATFAVSPVTEGVALGGAWSAVTSGAAERDGEPLVLIDVERLVGRLVEFA